MSWETLVTSVAQQCTIGETLVGCGTAVQRSRDLLRQRDSELPVTGDRACDGRCCCIGFGIMGKRSGLLGMNLWAVWKLAKPGTTPNSNPGVAGKVEPPESMRGSACSIWAMESAISWVRPSSSDSSGSALKTKGLEMLWISLAKMSMYFVRTWPGKTRSRLSWISEHSWVRICRGCKSKSISPVWVTWKRMFPKIHALCKGDPICPTPAKSSRRGMTGAWKRTSGHIPFSRATSAGCKWRALGTSWPWIIWPLALGSVGHTSLFLPGAMDGTLDRDNRTSKLWAANPNCGWLLGKLSLQQSKKLAWMPPLTALNCSSSCGSKSNWLNGSGSSWSIWQMRCRTPGSNLKDGMAGRSRSDKAGWLITHHQRSLRAGHNGCKKSTVWWMQLLVSLANSCNMTWTQADCLAWGVHSRIGTRLPNQYPMSNAPGHETLRESNCSFISPRCENGWQEMPADKVWHTGTCAATAATVAASAMLPKTLGILDLAWLHSWKLYKRSWLYMRRIPGWRLTHLHMLQRFERGLLCPAVGVEKP